MRSEFGLVDSEGTIPTIPETLKKPYRAVLGKYSQSIERESYIGGRTYESKDY